MTIVKRFLFVPLCLLLLVSCFAVFPFVPCVHATLAWASVGGNSPLYYIAVTLTNNQGSATSAGFQQQITINSNANSAVYASNLVNVNWQDGAGNILKSWLESGTTNTNTTSVYWVNLGSNTITANGGTLTIYQVIYATSVNAMDGVNTGAEPQYTSTYGQYDNGPTVFPTLYQNFAGTSTPSGWTNGGATINNGASIHSDYIITSSSFGLNSSQILDINATLPAPNSNGALVGYTDSGANNGAGWDVASGISSTKAFGRVYNPGANTAALVTTPSTDIWTVYAPNSSDTYFSWNYGSATTTTPVSGMASAEPVGSWTGTTSGTVKMQWVRIRMYPPSGVMPSASAGSITTISGSIAPIVSNISPSNLQTNVPITLTQLSFNLSSSQNLPMNYYVATSPSIGSGQGTGVYNGTYSVSVGGLNFNTNYAWSVNVTDGTLWTNETFTFTTESSPTITSYSPASQIILDRGSSQTFQISFSDPVATTWYLNGLQQQYTAAAYSSSWTYGFNALGIFNVTSAGVYGGSATAQTWSVQVIINFTGGVKTDGNLYCPPSQPWENGWIFDQTVWEYNNTYYMLFSGDAIGSRKIGFAWSYDGYNWTQYAGNPIISPVPGTWEPTETFWASSVILYGDNGTAQTYYCYYQGSTSASGVFFLTLSGTNIISVVQYSGNPIVTGTYELVVARYNATTWVGYNGYGGGSNLLLSSDGLNWQYVQKGGVLVPDGKSWDSSLLYQQHAFIMNGTLYLVVVGNNQQLGLYYCQVGDWASLTPSPYNPIIPSGSGYASYVLGGPSIYNSSSDTLDFWFSSVESLGGTGPSGVGFGRVYNVTGTGSTPVVSNPSPSEGATGMAISTSSLSFNLTDYDGGLMNYSVTTSPNIGTGSGLNVPNGQYSISVAGLNYSTTYYWTVTANAGAYATNTTFIFTTMVGPFDPFSSGWQYRKAITINHAKVAGDLTNFPVLISITDPDLASKACSNGYDILFMNGTGVAWKLNDEIESYNSTTGCLVAWVDIPSLSNTSDTVIYMYYGNPSASNQQNPTGVWDSNFVMVLHFDQTSGTQYDSTSYQNNATPYGVTEGVENGIIDGADSFGTGTPYLAVPNAPSLSPTVLTVEAWIQPNTVTGSHPIIEKYDYLAGTGGYIIRQSGNSLFFDVLQGTTDNMVWANNVLQIGNWYLVVGTFDGSYLKIYVNGTLVNEAAYTGSNLASSTSLKIGTRGNDGPSSGLFFSGIIDEARVSSIARSAAWIATEYNNEWTPSTFYTVGNEEPNIFNLSVVVVGQGSVWLNNTGPSYYYGDVVQFTAVPSVGWSFQNWSGDLTGSVNPTTLTMTGNKTVTATFTENVYTLIVSTVGSGHVTLNNTGPSYYYGDAVQLTATPALGWSFNGWSGGFSGSANPGVLTITGNMAVTATFTQNTYTLNVSVSPVGSGSVTLNDSGPYYYGDVVQLTAVPSAGWSFQYWSGDLSGSANPTTLTITGNMAVTAYFMLSQIPVVQTSPSTITCSKYGESFTVQVNVTNAVTMDSFSFTIYYSPALMSYVGVSWGQLGSGTITYVDQTNGIIEGNVAGTAISGNTWLLNITFQDTATLIWKKGQTNELDGQIWFNNASLNFLGVQLVYQQGGLDQISVNNAAFKFVPIQGDINNDGVVNITDLRIVAAYFDVKQGDPLWSVASNYDLNGDGVIDIYDLVLIAANFGYTYP